MSGLPFVTITELATAYRRRELSPVEVTQAMLQRIERLDPALRSYFTVTAEIALEQARAAETEIVRGQWRGPMHGVPIGLKDLCNTRSVRTTWGTAILAEYLPDADATVVTKLCEAGAVMLGKLAMTEGAFAAHHPRVADPVNPWHADHWTGISSSGSGVAVAAGLCFGAIGSDTGGSIRLPSAANGVTGLKPTWGRVSRHGVWPLADSLDHLGPMTRSAADAGAMFAAIAGPDPLDPTTLDAPVPDCLADIEAGIAGVRIGFDPHWIYDGCRAETAQVLDDARRVLEGLGAVLLEIAMPARTQAMSDGWTPLCAAEAALAHEQWFPARRAEYGKVLAGLLDKGRSIGGIELARILRDRLLFAGELRKLLTGIDLILCPVHAFGNPTAEDLLSIVRKPGGSDAMLRYTAPFDMSGSPTITLPGGFDERGAPIGFQLVARHLDEALLVRAGHAFQQATDWHRRHPPL